MIASNAIQVISRFMSLFGRGRHDNAIALLVVETCGVEKTGGRGSSKTLAHFPGRS